MGKEEFLNGLQKALTGNVPQSVIYENLTYYRDYIDDQIRKGNTEEDVVNEIGDPRLIAKTIEETTEDNDAEQIYQSSEREQGGYYSNQQNTFKYFRLDKWYHKILLGLIAALVIFLIVIILIFLAQLAIPIAIVMMIIWFIRRLRS